MQSLNEIKNRIRRMTASLLTIVLLITGIPFPVSAEAAYEEYLDGWEVQCAWSNMSQDYGWDASKSESRQPKMVLTYQIENAQKDYPAGTLQFAIPGIGNANRGSVRKADKVAADHQDSEWDYTWDSLRDIYTFTNKFQVNKGDTVSGGFELLWKLRSRDCVDGFEQKKSPVFTVTNAGEEGAPEAKSITMQPLSYRFTSVRDRYRVEMSSGKLSVAEYDDADKDYIWYDIETRFYVDLNARGLHKADFYVWVELPEGAGRGDIRVTYGGSPIELTLHEDGRYGFYLFRNRYGNIGTEPSSFHVGVLKDSLEGQEITVYGHLDRLYHDESEWVKTAGENEVVDASIPFTVEEYHFEYGGYIYGHEKWGSYEMSGGGEPYDYNDRLNALNIYNGKVVQFHLSGSANRQYGRSQAWQSGTATPSNASSAAIATPSDADYSHEEDIPEGIEDWNDIHWRENRQPEDTGDTGRPTYGELHPEYWTATPSDANEDGDGEVLVPDITFFGQGIERVRGLFEIQAYAAETATPSDASEEKTTEAELTGTKPGGTKPGGNTSGQSQIGEDEPYSLVLGDDKLAIFLNNALIRNLEDHEYDIAYVTVPPDRNDYDYDVYTANTQDTHFDGYVYSGSGNTGQKETIPFADGVKAVFIEMKGIRGSYYMKADVGVRLHLDWAEQQGLEEALRPDHENRLVNFSYLRALYRDEDGLSVNDCVVEEDSYKGEYGQALAERDDGVYQEYLLRDFANVWLRSPVTELVSSTALHEFDSNGSEGFTSQVQTFGKIKSDNPGTLERFSLYTVLPDGLRADFDNTEITVKGSGTDITGAAVSDSQFASHVIISTGEYQDNILLKADFNFSDAPLEGGLLTQASIGFPVTLSAVDLVSYGSSYTVNSYLMAHDDGLDRISGHAITADAYDIDDDGMTTEKMAYSKGTETVEDDVMEWREYASKYVKTAFSGGSYMADTVTRRYEETESEKEKAQSVYSYRLDFGLGASNAKNIWFFDRIEQGARIADHKKERRSYTEIDSGWQGEFQSVDTSFAEGLGLVPTVYYSENQDQEFDPEAQGWTLEPGETVKAIAVSLDTGSLKDGMMKTKQMVYVTVNMRAPAEEAFIGKKAVNQFEVQYDGCDLHGDLTATYTLPSAATYVTLLDSVGKLVLQKVDADHEIRKDPEGNPIYAALTGATFQVYDSGKMPLFKEPKELNALGRIVINNVTNGTYYWEEMTAPIGYEKRDGQHKFTVDGMQGIIQIANKRLPGSVILTKYDADSTAHRTLPGAEFELYRADGGQVYTQSGSDGEYEYAETGTNGRLETGTDGTLRVSSLPWGSYYFVEAKAPEGYETDGEQLPFRIGQSDFTDDNEFIEVKVTAENSQLPASVLLVKKDAEDDTVLKDAYYDLYRKQEGGGNEDNSEENWSKLYESLKTNAAGEIMAEDLKFGTYRFVEVQPPSGYELNGDPVVFTLDSSTVGELVEVTQSDKRKTGSAVLTKRSEDGMPLKDAKFDLYYKGEDGEDALQVASNLITGENGQTMPVEELKWGEYYYLETAAPEGYVLNTEPVGFTVNAENADAGVQVSADNKRMRGSVVLTKMAERPKTSAPAEEVRLDGAVFNLYRQDGTLVQKDLTTKTDEATGGKGTVRVDGLDWGSYYFEETKAPEGYGLYPGKIRFSVNSQNSSAVQRLTCYDPIEQVQITIHKEINEQLEAFGVPTFLFKITGTDISGDKHEWIKSLTLAEDNEGRGTVVLSGIKAGTYTVTELGVERYQLTEVKKGANVTVGADGKSAIATVNTSDKKEAEVTFISAMTQYEKFSHVTNATNLVNAKRKVTAFEVTYVGPPVIKSETECKYKFIPEDLEAVAHYDDGTTETVPFEELKLNPATVTGTQNTDGSGQTITVTHEVDGDVFTDTFSVEIQLQIPKVPYKITYDANGGYFGQDADKSINVMAYLWDEEKQSNQLESGTYAEPEHRTEVFVGWYTDEECTDGLEFDSKIWLEEELTEDIRVYAKWKEPKAVFEKGSKLNAEMKTLTGNRLDQITGIKESATMPDFTSGEDVSIVSTEESEVPIYMWFADSVIYWWSKDKTPELNRDSGSVFSELTELTDISGIKGWSADNVEKMNSMFYQCKSLDDVSVLSEWTVEKVTNMSGMFRECGSLTDLGPLPRWKVDNVTDMGTMFYECSSLRDLTALEDWKVGNVTNMRSMFRRCSSLRDLTALTDWDVGSVTGMGSMFAECSSLETLTDLNRLTGWNVSNVTDMGSMFSGCSSLKDLTVLKDWNVSNVTNMEYMFIYCEKLADLTALSKWNVEKVTDMNNMFHGCVGLTDLGELEGRTALTNWNVGNVTSMFGMFMRCSGLRDLTALTDWNVGNVTNMSEMFNGCSGLTDLTALTGWEVDNVINMSKMFASCSGLKDLGKLEGRTGLTDWNVSKVIDMGWMFFGCKKLNDLSALSNWRIVSVTNMERMFTYCNVLTNLNALQNWEVSSVTDMSEMFFDCTSLDNLDGLRDWKVGNVTDMSAMFACCSRLPSLVALEKWEVGNVTRMVAMFTECYALTTLEGLETWSVGKVTTMDRMFDGNYNLMDPTAINDWDVNKVEERGFFNMFGECNVNPDFSMRPGTWNGSGTFIPDN